MSFYLDNDDDWVQRREVGILSSVKTRKPFGSNFRSSSPTEEGFVCDNCGSAESYLDETSGGLTCSECFTQSQTVIAASQEEVDYDEVMALAGRLSGGHLAAAASPAKRQKRKRKRLEELDQTNPLPKTQDCIRGMQRLLCVTTRIVAKLIRCRPEDAQTAMTTTRNIWHAYLWSWTQAAEHFGTIYPEVRLCFRDSFLSMPLRVKILKTLAHRASRKVRAEFTPTVIDDTASSYLNTNEGSNGIPSKMRRFDRSLEVNDNGDDVSRSSDLTAEDDVEKQKFKGDSTTTISGTIARHYRLARKQMVGRKVAALSLLPSLNMVAAVLCLSFSPWGVSSREIQRWIAEGSLPLLNAFWLLTPQEQKLLGSIQAFFRLQKPPSVSAIEKIVAGLQVACGYKPRKILIRKGRDRRVYETISSKNFVPGRQITPRTMPLVLARLVSSLGLPQIVMAYSSVLIGFPMAGLECDFEGSRDSGCYLLSPLSLCRSDRLLKLVNLLGVIAFACKHLPCLQVLQFHRSLSKKMDIENLDLKETDKDSFTPWNEVDSRFLSNARSDSYLRLAEDALIIPGTTVVQSTTTFQHEPQQTAKIEDTAFSSVEACPIDFGVYKSKQRPSAQNIVLASPACTKSAITTGSVQTLILAPFAALVDLMAKETGVCQSEILDFVEKLEGETRKRQQMKAPKDLTCHLQEAYTRYRSTL